MEFVKQSLWSSPKNFVSDYKSADMQNKIENMDYIVSKAN